MFYALHNYFCTTGNFTHDPHKCDYISSLTERTQSDGNFGQNVHSFEQQRLCQCSTVLEQKKGYQMRTCLNVGIITEHLPEVQKE
jgi:hypothetical protein